MQFVVSLVNVVKHQVQSFYQISTKYKAMVMVILQSLYQKILWQQFPPGIGTHSCSVSYSMMRIQRVFLSSLRQSQFNTFHSTRYQLYCLDTGVIRWEVCLTYLHMNMQRNLNNRPLDLQDWSAASNIKPCASILQYVSKSQINFCLFHCTFPA